MQPIKWRQQYIDAKREKEKYLIQLLELLNESHPGGFQGIACLCLGHRS